MVGNKCDLTDKREVNVEDAIDCAKKKEFAFFETSAKERTNVNEVFVELLSQILARERAYEERERVSREKERTAIRQQVKDVALTMTLPKNKAQGCCQEVREKIRYLKQTYSLN
eukprot:TRINITY_DN2571_c0_g5_i1.p1 TRINITY_DN2571_c0_g5~~TRINITY_DN2571_c0_g5_i1.p1  ORF type:complete len:114 (+),score=10.56 TRINITY_DN2571_c0_g5_i1:349-690(+)